MTKWIQVWLIQNLTLTRVVFEFLTGSEPPRLNVDLTLTRVVFE